MKSMAKIKWQNGIMASYHGEISVMA